MNRAGMRMSRRILGIATIAFLIGLVLLGTPGRSPPITPTVTIWIHRVQALDPFDNSTFPEFYYWVGIKEQGQWDWRTDTAGPGTGPDRIVDDNVTFSVDVVSIGIAIVVCDGDDSSPDDAGDLSARPGGGPDDVPGEPCAVSSLGPPEYGYQGNWSVVTGSLSGDAVTAVNGTWMTSGEGDGSIGWAVDENDAAVWFGVSDDYDLPTADAGPGLHVLVGDGIVLNGSASNGSAGSSLTEFAWDLSDDGTYDRYGSSITVNYTSAGNFTVRLRVVDVLGMTSTDTVFVNVAYPPRTVSEPPWSWILMLLAFLLFLMLFLLWLRRRRRSKDVTPASPPIAEAKSSAATSDVREERRQGREAGRGRGPKRRP